MTGFGRAEVHHGPAVYHAEVRSVNNRGLKVNAKLDETFAFLESRIEPVVKRFAHRGCVYVAITRARAHDQPDYRFSTDALRAYYDELKAIQQQLGSRGEIRLADLINLPGVLRKASDTDDADDALWARLAAPLEQALEQMRRMREAEGVALGRDLAQRCQRLRELLAQVEARNPAAVAEYRERLTERVAELLKPVGVEIDGQNLYREVAVYAERSDMAEEIARLKSHADQLLAGIESDEPVGRKLEFIAQEMFREANTMASKANDADLVNIVLDVKGEVDKVREQILNVE